MERNTVVSATKTKNRPKNRIKRSRWVRLVYVKNIDHNIPTTATYPPQQHTHHSNIPTTATYPPQQHTHHCNIPITTAYPPQQHTHHSNIPTTATYPPQQHTHHVKVSPRGRDENAYYAKIRLYRTLGSAPVLTFLNFVERVPLNQVSTFDLKFLMQAFLSPTSRSVSNLEPEDLFTCSAWIFFFFGGGGFHALRITGSPWQWALQAVHPGSCLNRHTCTVTAVYTDIRVQLQLFIQTYMYSYGCLNRHTCTVTAV